MNWYKACSSGLKSLFSKIVAWTWTWTRRETGVHLTLIQNFNNWVGIVTENGLLLCSLFQTWDNLITSQDLVLSRVSPCQGWSYRARHRTCNQIPNFRRNKDASNSCFLFLAVFDGLKKGNVHTCRRCDNNNFSIFGHLELFVLVGHSEL